MWAAKSFISIIKAGFLWSLLMLPTALFSQELLVPLTGNAFTRKLQSNGRTRSSPTMNTLPFLDDFSRNDQGLPIAKNWSKAQVFVNNGYGAQSPTPYVATFDVLNADGELYEQATYDSFSADTLTSVPLALSGYTTSDSVSLYFQIQAGGKGAFPSDGDTLSLDFFNPQTQTWQVVWSALPYTVSQKPGSLVLHNWLTGRVKEYASTESVSVSDVFYRTMISIPDSCLKDGFVFRFRNVGSLSRLDAIPGMAGNTDHWNLSLVYVNKRTANDTVFFRDVLLMEQAKSVLKGYSAMPWRHFKDNTSARLLLLDDDRAQSFRMTYRSAGYRPLQVGRQFTVEEVSVPSNAFRTEVLWDRLETDETFAYVYHGYDFNFSSAATDSADFCIRSILGYTGAQSPFTTNDTLTYIQHFKDYYSYDDGQAENGYGLFGRWASGSMVAVKYKNELAVGDTIKGLYIFFNRAYQNANQNSLKLAIWSDFNGYPGTRLYDTLAVQPSLGSGTGGWEYFPLVKPVVVQGDFYVGWEQVGENMLNVGFDVNCTISGKHYLNEGAGWALSAYNGKGIPMIRPAFGHIQALPTATVSSETGSWKVYPNPCQNRLFVSASNVFTGHFQVSIYSLKGELLKVWNDNPTSLDVGFLMRGIYLIRITVMGRTVLAHPLVIQ